MNGTKRGQESGRNNCAQIKYNIEKWLVYCPAETRSTINVACEMKCSLTEHTLSTIVKSGTYIALQLKRVA